MNNKKRHSLTEKFRQDIITWDAFDKKTEITGYKGVPIYTNEFWTSKQRAGNSLHEISYRACFKPQLPNFFISRLTEKGDVVFDPFMGRGTTLLEAILMGRETGGNDVNPLSEILVAPRLMPPTLEEVALFLKSFAFSYDGPVWQDLQIFFEKQTLLEIYALREYFIETEKARSLTNVEKWVRMVAVNRLTGHSKGFFSVYTLPPNQATSIERQRKINQKRSQIPEYRDTKKLILGKTKSLLKDYSHTNAFQKEPIFFNKDINDGLPDSQPFITLSVTSPPFLNIVDYKSDNWLRCWFLGIDSEDVAITQTPKIDEWRGMVEKSLTEVAKLTLPGGYFAFEVGEVRNGKIKLEELVIEASRDTPWTAELVLVNEQDFTKTSNAWGVQNNKKGTNSNRIVLFSLRS